MTDVFAGKYFNENIKGEIRKNFLKRVIKNGMTGSSWQFKCFENFLIIVTDINQVKSLSVIH